jgi:DNA segregation ATPase FtsK/SpoIIIE-like protein
VETRDKFIQRYRDAYMQYIDQDETEEDDSFEAFDPAAILAELGDEKKVSDESVSNDELYEKALEIVFETGKVATSLLQQRLLIGYGRAAHLIDKLEEEGIISAPNENEPRKVLLTKEEYQARKQ